MRVNGILSFFSFCDVCSADCRSVCFKRDKNVGNFLVYKPYTTHNSSIRSDEGLTLETSAFQFLYGGQFTLSTLLIKQIFVYHSPTDAAPQFL